MVDTIALTILQKNFTILDHKRFTPSSKNLFEPPYLEFGRTPFIKCTNNPTLTDIQKYGYLPRLTIMKAVRKDDFEISLKIEFSIPKLLYGNNFDEIEESDFGEIGWKLKNFLPILGIEIDEIYDVTNAEVSMIHYGKNIILTDFTDPYSILKEVAKVNISQWMDINSTDYRNEGHVVKFHSNDYEIVFYDKLKDLQQAKKSEKRAIEKDSLTQLSLFDLIPPKQPFEVLRMEIRLGSRKKIKSVLIKNQLKSEKLTFVKLFSKKKAKKIIKSVFNDIKNRYPSVLALPKMTMEETFAELQINNLTFTLNKLLSVLGAKILFDEIGIRKFRESSKRFDKRNFYRLMSDIKNVNIGKNLNKFGCIDEVLNKFEKVRLEDHKEKIYDADKQK